MACYVGIQMIAPEFKIRQENLWWDFLALLQCEWAML